mgnify:FL=1
MQVENFLEAIRSIVPKDYGKPGDYRDGEGFLVCGNCHTRKETLFYMPAIGKSPAEVIKVPCACECENKAWEEKHAQQSMRERKLYIEQLRREGMMDPVYDRNSFERDDGRNPDALLVCVQYVEKWNKMLEDNVGLLLYGSVGTGKTFFAGCIANALTEKLVSVGATSLPKLIGRLQTYQEERMRLLSMLEQYDFLILDDLGAERDTSFAAEQTYLVIDTRYRVRKPLIITTNMSLEELHTPQTTAQERIYDRVLEMCPIKVKLAGESKRKAMGTHKESDALRSLWWDKNEV